MSMSMSAACVTKARMYSYHDVNCNYMEDVSYVLLLGSDRYNDRPNPPSGNERGNPTVICSLHHRIHYHTKSVNHQRDDIWRHKLHHIP
jgi:hypothetical protein